MARKNQKRPPFRGYNVFVPGTTILATDLPYVSWELEPYLKFGLGRRRKTERDAHIRECFEAEYRACGKRSIAVKRAAQRFDLAPDSIRKVLRNTAKKNATK
jgi:hypothetical protein